MLNEANIGTLLVPGGAVYEKLLANNAWYGWKPGLTPVVFIHCPDDDVVPYQNAERAAAALAGLAPVKIVDIPALPLVADLLGTQHVAAFPSAMLAAFIAIDGLN